MRINTHTSHPSAFISSTFQDLHIERRCVADILQKRGLNVNALDIKPASNDSSKKEIISGIRESDFIILIIGDRYGSVEQNITGSNTRSLTWWEYIYAMRFGKPVLSYFKNITSFDLRLHDDPSDRLYKVKRIQLEQFKKLIKTKHNPAYFSNAQELAGKVDKSLIAVYRNGVSTLLKRNSELSTKTIQLENENRNLKNSIENKALHNTTLSANSLSNLLSRKF